MIGWVRILGTSAGEAKEELEVGVRRLSVKGHSSEKVMEKKVGGMDLRAALKAGMDGAGETGEEL